MTLRPVFILSLPRSGSTLLQSLLASSPQVSTAAEPWLLLPLAYSTRASGVLAEYRHSDAVKAIREFVSDDAGALGPYWTVIGDLVREMYRRSAHPGATVFVDKTPRYHLIVDELATIFPDAAFVFLWRNPLAVVSSIIETWGDGRWNIDHFDVDVYRGISNLTSAADDFADRSVEVRYEDLVADPIEQVRRITAFLDLDPIDDEAVLRVDGVTDTGGRFGDQVGIHQYTGIASESVEKWMQTLANPVRKRWARRYLDSLGVQGLDRMGYSHARLTEQLAAVPSRLDGSLDDVVRMVMLGSRRIARNAALSRTRTP